MKKTGKIQSEIDDYLAKASHLSNYDARKLAQSMLGKDIFYSWEIPRTREGYYHFRAGIPAALKRSLAFAPYADLLWLETKKPDPKQAVSFANEIRSVYQGKWLVYNLSPSFNWLGEGFVPEELRNFVFDLAKSGYVGKVLPVDILFGS